MSKLLLVSNNQEFKNICTLLIEARLSNELLIAKNYSTASYWLDTESQISLIITDLDISEPDGKNLYDFNKQNRQIPYLLAIDKDEDENIDLYKFIYKDSKFNHVIFKGLLKQDLISSMMKVLRRKQVLSEANTGPIEHNGVELYRIKVSFFMTIDKASSDVYLKLSSGKLLKIIKAGDEITHANLENYINKGQEYLYQDKKSYDEYVTESFDKLSRKLKDHTLTVVGKLALQMHSIKHVQDTVRVMGLSEESIDFTTEVVKSVEDVLKKNKNIMKLVKTLLKNKSYFFTRVSICNYLLGGLVHKIGWDSHTTLKKLVFASVFCDFGFNFEQEDLAQILSKDSKEFKALTKIHKSIIESHPIRGVEALEKSTNFLTDEATIILQHHEKPDGTGFPKGLNKKQIPPLSCAFILVYDFTQKLISSVNDAKDINTKSLLDELGPEYSQASFEKPYNALKAALNL